MLQDKFPKVQFAYWNPIHRHKRDGLELIYPQAAWLSRKPVSVGDPYNFPLFGNRPDLSLLEPVGLRGKAPHGPWISRRRCGPS